MEGRLERYDLFGTIFQVYPMSPQETCSVTRTGPKVSQRRFCINTVYLCWNIQSNPRLPFWTQDDTTCHQEDSTTCSPCLNRRYQIVYLLPLERTKVNIFFSVTPNWDYWQKTNIKCSHENTVCTSAKSYLLVSLPDGGWRYLKDTWMGPLL